MALDELLAKQVPYSIEAEQAVLGSMLIDPKRIPEVMEVLKQDQYAPMSVEQQVVQLYAASNGGEGGAPWIRSIPTAQISRRLRELSDFVAARHPDLLEEIGRGKVLSDALRARIDAVLAEFKASAAFLAE